MPKPADALRLPRVMAGLVLFGAGIALMVRGDLGLAPWDVLHQGLAERTGASLGTVVIIVGLVVLVGMIWLGEPIGLGTVLNVFVIGIALDLTLSVVPPLSDLWMKASTTLLGPVVIAIGSGLYIGAGLGPGPRDGLMTGLAKRGVRVWIARTGIEMAALVGGVLLGGTIGLGTVWFALGVGPLVDFFLRWFPDRRESPAPRRSPRHA